MTRKKEPSKVAKSQGIIIGREAVREWLEDQAQQAEAEVEEAKARAEALAEMLKLLEDI